MSLNHIFCLQDRRADLVIHTYVDDLMQSLMNILKIDIEKYEEINDPTKTSQIKTDWTIYETYLQNLREMKKNATKCYKKQKRPLPKLPMQESESELSQDNQILKPSKISKLNNIDNIIK